MSANYINIYGILHNDTPEGVIAEAGQILDVQEGKKQEAINRAIVDYFKKARETLHITFVTPTTYEGQADGQV